LSEREVLADFLTWKLFELVSFLSQTIDKKQQILNVAITPLPAVAIEMNPNMWNMTGIQVCKDADAGRNGGGLPSR
jgi:hypothetical protein